MAIQIKNTEFVFLGKDKFSRCNFKTKQLFDEIEGCPIKNYNRLKDLFIIIPGYAFKSKDYIVDGTPLIRISDLDIVGLDLNKTVKLPEDYYSYEPFQKYKIKKNDILISLTGDGNMKTLFIDADIKALLNQRVAILRPKKELNILVYYHLLNSNFVKKQFTYYSNGKTQKNISPYDFLNIKLPVINEEIENKIFSSIIPIINKIGGLSSSSQSIQRIIDSVLQREFEFNYEKFEELKRNNRFVSSMVSFANNPDLRCSAKFHRPAGVYVQQELNRITTKKIKHYLGEPTILGASVSPSDYDENGDYQYLSMATIKNWEFESEAAQYVSTSYSNLKAEITIKYGDLILARSGEGTIGKVALIEEEDVKAVFADFTMRIRLKNYNLKFAYYYMRSTYFQYLIEIYKKGLGNNTNIFPIVIREFPLPDISLEEQQRIVNEIQAEIDKQNDIKKQILSLRQEIDKIIESVVCDIKLY